MNNIEGWQMVKSLGRSTTLALSLSLIFRTILQDLMFFIFSLLLVPTEKDSLVDAL